MTKQNKNQIRENIRNQVAKQFSCKIKNLQEDIKRKDEYIARLEDLYHKAASELSEMKEKRDMQEEWIERMQDFCNMTDEDRKEYLEQQRTEHRLNKSMSHVMDVLDNLIY